ncbi:SagB/ThcOx family dehydrogenase [Patescibacteria group bacterium]|nr:SagB/ThcOx family dehydrogenase [Patescibacteria group bacterium]
MQKNEKIPSEMTKETSKDSCSSEEGCETCMKGGFPMKKEALSFITLAMIAVTTVLAVLLINEKRANLSSPALDSKATVESVAKTYEMPAIKATSEKIELPDPKITGKMSVEEAIQIRRSKRVYSEEPVTLSELSQILWSAQGITDESGHRTAPSARSVYPYSLYVVVRNVEGLDSGLYLYDPESHTLGNLDLANAGELLATSGVQDNSQKAPVVIAMTAVFAKTAVSFPDNPEEVTFLEGGHIGQNIYLQAESMKMATVVTAGFDVAKIGEILGLDRNETIVYLIPFGHPGIEVSAEH